MAQSRRAVCSRLSGGCHHLPIRSMSIPFHRRQKSFDVAKIPRMNRIYASNSPAQPPKPPTVLPLEEDGTVVAERQTQKPKPPPMCQVLMLNDDFTPMEFVVAVLQEFFGKNLDMATQIMLAIHNEGRGVCGVYPREIAETKVALVMDAAAQAGHPLQCVCEPLSD